ncbi:cation/H(+) antiporter 2-like [Populus nigra]|uniref:cation/H(+) antiporter 2-like n=1 Tax=Populus nigra TaxID=3691 RepID=UPI002B26C7FA|nr:cation/H(+) antiporter 2-like [Populus nigra]XP_061979825.1 cation/H(+) antiporter 2-like [Populus nigra]
MEAARRALCVSDPFNPLITTFAQSAGILVISHCFHLFLKQFGQPGPVAQILAGIVLGPSLLSRIPKVNRFFIQSSTADYYEVIEAIFRTVFMFLIGLEMDIPYMRRSLRKASIIASGGVIVGVLFGIAVSISLIILLKIKSQLFDFATIIIIALTNSASPVVFRLAAELKFLTSDTGRLAVCASLITEMFCVLWRSVSLAVDPWKNLGTGILFLLMTVTLIGINKYLASWCNQRIRNQKYVTNTEFLVFLFLLIAAALFIEEYGYNSAISCFLLGLMFPREGKTTRTLLHKLSYATYNFILPVYFGYIGFQLNVSILGGLKPLITVIVMIVMSIATKIIGTLVACHYLKISTDEGIVLGFLLDLKGNAELQILGKLPKETMKQWEEADVHGMVLTVVVINTVIAGVVVAHILRKKEEYFSHSHISLELGEHESELRMLACVYGSRNISSKIGLISAFSESLKTPVTTYLMHLVELPKKRTKKNLMYHQLQDGDQYSDEEDYGGNDVVEINDAVDAYTMETKVLIHQRKVVSYFERMYEDVCDSIEDLRVSIIFLTFHKHQRLDGKMESGKDGMRTTNHKVMRHAPCSVGIFVDRGQTGFQQPSSQSVQNIATLFFGGPDDREALACSKMISNHPHIHLTLIHFQNLPSSKQTEYTNEILHRNDELLMEMSNHEIEADIDRAYTQDFYNRYVTSGQVGYVEKYVENGTQTAEALRDIHDTFSLLIVGKGGRGNSPMTTGMSDWEECPELGTVGDLLASSELNTNSSVLVIQQYRHSRNDLN